MNIKHLRDLLADLDRRHDGKELVVWLPGSRIDLENSFMILDGDETIMVEGNVRPGSALEG